MGFRQLSRARETTNFDLGLTPQALCFHPLCGLPPLNSLLIHFRARITFLPYERLRSHERPRPQVCHRILVRRRNNPA
jgi:hypothetical protein